jgi:hypothetical protein
LPPKTHPLLGREGNNVDDFIKQSRAMEDFEGRRLANIKKLRFKL